MNFASDNWAGVHPAVAHSLQVHGDGYAKAYGASALDKRVQQLFNDIFERDVAVFFVGTGTAANALAMTMFNRPGGVVFCHSNAHMIADEGGAPEAFTGGARLCPVDGNFGRMDVKALETAISRYPADFVHAGQPMAVSVTQSTEVGTVYSVDEIRAISACCQSNELPLHMDGARFANGLVALDASPAEMSWQSGIDALSFGGTKNGCWCAEALVVFDPELARQVAFLRKRAGHLFSKSRFIAAQFDGYFRDGLWLENARHANHMAQALAKGIDDLEGAQLAWQPQANEVFVMMEPEIAKVLRDKGGQFYEWPVPSNIDLPPEQVLYRLVTSFSTSLDEVHKFCEQVSCI